MILFGERIVSAEGVFFFLQTMACSSQNSPRHQFKTTLSKSHDHTPSMSPLHMVEHERARRMGDTLKCIDMS
jgi:hypothetical protein